MDGAPQLGSIMQLAKEVDIDRHAAKEALTAAGGDYDAALAAVIAQQRALGAVAAQERADTPPAASSASAPAPDGFEAASTFAGARRGFLFTAGEAGVGYYPDPVGAAAAG